MRTSPRARKTRALVAAWTRRATVSAVAALLLAVGAWVTWSEVIPFVTAHDYFRLRSIRISSDETRVAPQALAEIAGLYEDASLWQVDPAAIQAELKDASWVKQATVTRHFPWQVSLSVSRRHATAAAVSGGKAYLVDKEGVLFHEVEEIGAPDLPYLTGWDAAEAHAEQAARLRALLGVLAEASGRSVEVSELHMDDDGTVWLYAAGVKASVRLGQSARAAAGLDRLAIALKELGPLADRARLIDTDYPDRIVIRGADDKLPAMLAAQTDRALAPREAPGEPSDARGAGKGAAVKPVPSQKTT
jgi:cell division septal protein FtsQ